MSHFAKVSAVAASAPIESYASTDGNAHSAISRRPPTSGSGRLAKHATAVLRSILLGLSMTGLFAHTTRVLCQNVTTQQFDNSRDGLQSQEALLNPSNVSPSSFGKLFSLAVSGHVYAQPLYMAAVTMGDGTTHNVLFVATEQDYVYAFDADGNNPPQGYLWRESLLGPNETWASYNDVNSSDIYPDIGITGTPVIDPTTLTLFVVAKSKTSSGAAQFFQRLHALSLADGSERLNGPTLIQATVPGTGDHATTISFNPLLNNQRAGLLLASTPNGSTPASVFIAWSSHGDNGSYHGWVISYSSSDISKQTGVWSDSPNGSKGGIWMSGGALSSDNLGNIFGASGNGSFDASSNGSDYGDSAFSLAINGSILSPTGYFTPADQNKLDMDDLDLGMTSMMLLPAQTGPFPNLVVEADKTGTVYLMNSGALGGYAAQNNAPLQSFNIGHTIRTSAAFFNNTMYLAGEGGPLSAWQFNPQTQQFATSPATTSTATFGCSDCGGAGTTPAISANGNSNAIVWVLDNTARENGPAILRAYDPINLQNVLYDSTQAANKRDAAAIAVKFTTPVVVNGHVYVGGINAVTVYGELNSFPTVTVGASPPSIPPGSSSILNVTATNATQVTLSGSDGTTYTLSPTGGTQSVSPSATTTYTATAVGASASVTSTTTVTVALAPATVTLTANPATITAGSSSILTVSASNASQVTITGTDGSSYRLPNSGGMQTVAPAKTTTFTAVATGSGGNASANATVTVTSSTTGCLPSGPGAIICAPAQGSSAASPVTITAGATAQNGTIAALRVYIDNTAVLTVNNPSATKSFQFSQPVTVNAGNHYLVIVGYQSTGGDVRATENFTAGATSGCAPPSAGAMICSPGQNATVSSPVLISAAATAPSGYIAAIRIYVDNIAQALVNNPQRSKSFSINQPISMSEGHHTIVIVAYPTSGGAITASDSISIP